MVDITERARRRLKSMLDRVEKKRPGQVLRLRRDQEGRFLLGLDREKAGDEVVEYQGSAIMVVGADIAPALEGATVDTRETPSGTELAVTRVERR